MNKEQAFDRIKEAFTNWISDWTWEDDASQIKLHTCLAYIEAIVHCVDEDGSDNECQEE